MLSELMVRGAIKMLGDHSPDGRAYWAARFWDRVDAEAPVALKEPYESEKVEIRSLLHQYAGDATTFLEVACGTGEFTRYIAEMANAEEITALDISSHAIAIAAGRVPEGRVTFRQADIWQADNLGIHDVVVCVDAIHHLGRVPDVLRRLKSLVRPGGLFIGNLWTMDRFHDLQRHRFGAVRHGIRSAAFLGTAVLIRCSGGRLRTHHYRTHLIRGRDVRATLAEHFDVLHVAPDAAGRHFVPFACRVP
jgi:SAM-dependent methyltransferase